MSLRNATAAAALGALTAMLQPNAVLADRSRDVSLSQPLGSGGTVEIDDVNGTITVASASGGNVTIHGHATTSGAEPGPVVRTSRRGNRLIVCAVFPGDRGSGDCSQHSHGGGDEHLRIDLNVGVPRGVNVVADDVNGDVTAQGLDAAINASAVNGAVDVATTGTASASTVNGSIHARFSGRGNASFRSVNGAINLSVPRDANATFSGETLSGDISASGVALATKNGQFVGHSATATLGAGSGQIRARTVSGAIHLERR